MSTLLLLVLPPLTALVIIIMGAIWLTNVLADRFVGRKHRLLEEIIATGKMPETWLKAQSNQQHNRKARQKLRRKLDNLIHYAQTTPLVADEETRQQVLEKLNAVRADWTDHGEDQPG